MAVMKTTATVAMMSLLSLTMVKAALTQTEKDTLLQLHNKARRETGGANLYQMVWDDTIAANAQSYANTCPGGHSATTSRPGLGENLAWGWPSRTVENAMNGWVEQEIGYFTFGNSNWCNGAGECRHYTQIVWSNTYKLGCGKTRCATVSGYESYGSGDAYVCQYGPAGNIVGSQPYAIGTPCSQCSGTCNAGLCVKATTCQPGYLTISGASVVPDMNGLYAPGVPATINGKPHYVGDQYHIYWRSADSRWLIDTDTSDSGYIGYVYDSAATPDKIVKQWNVWPKTGSSFPVDATMKITACPGTAVTTTAPVVTTTVKPTVAITTTARPIVTTTAKPTVATTTARPVTTTVAPTSCPTGSVRVVGSTRLPIVNGIYKLVSAGKYLQQGSTRTLYYIAQNGRWILDDGWDPTSIYGYVASTATNPTTITTTWQVWPGTGTVFLADAGLKIQTCS